MLMRAVARFLLDIFVSQKFLADTSESVKIIDDNSG